MNKTTSIIIIVVIVIIGGYFLLDNKDQNNRIPIEQDRIQTTSEQKQFLGDSNVKEFVLVGTNFEFSMKEIRVKQGDMVRMVFKNEGGLHDWKIDELNVSTKIISTGEEEIIEFTADSLGEFEYYCSVGNHRELGMRGKLIIE